MIEFNFAGQKLTVGLLGVWTSCYSGIGGECFASKTIACAGQGELKQSGKSPINPPVILPSESKFFHELMKVIKSLCVCLGCRGLHPKKTIRLQSNFIRVTLA